MHSVFGKGTTIKMTLPLTMAIVSCLIVKSGGERFAIPQLNLEELVIVKPGEVSKKKDSFVYFTETNLVAAFLYFLSCASMIFFASWSSFAASLTYASG